jgi:hypothetical protein
MNIHTAVWNLFCPPINNLRLPFFTLPYPIMDTAINEYHLSHHLGAYVELFWTGQFNLNRTALLSQRVIPNGYIELIISNASEAAGNQTASIYRL